MRKNNKAADLLKVLGQKTTTATEPARAPAAGMPQGVPPERLARPAKTQTQRSGPPKGARGKAVQFYLHEADEKLIREFAVWLAPHRKRINDSLIIKAVLRAAKSGPDLLAGYDAGFALSRAHQKAKRRPEGG